MHLELEIWCDIESGRSGDNPKKEVPLSNFICAKKVTNDEAVERKLFQEYKDIP